MDIEVYTKDNCPKCVEVKAHLTKQGFEFTEIQINEENIDMLKVHTRSAPGVFIDGDFIPNESVFNL
ncbi:MAG: glutaredoxin [Thiomicrorhabdus sp.]|jgi:glutaredoxin|nr:glutaredoxin [Thiomicrorhabdus sp.]